MVDKDTRSQYGIKKNSSDLNNFWSGIRKGNAEALAQLYYVSYPWLFNYGYRIVPEEAFVKDAIQELFLILWKKRKGINEARSVKSYLYSSLHRLIFRRIRKQKNRTERNYDYKQFFSKNLQTIEALIIDSEVDRERQEKILQAIDLLSDRQKEAIFLKYYDGLTNTEIACIMDINKQSVYNHVFRAINKMQDFVHSKPAGI